MPRASILEVLIDVHRWTGFLDAFEPLSGRQNMSDAEKYHHVLGALYAYGCGCGPTQAARAVGLAKNQIVYIRRHYMARRQLVEASLRPARAYDRTRTAGRLGQPGVLLTDAMHVRTLRGGLEARPYYRDPGHPNVLLYQHVTGHLVCRFTQAIRCNVSEGLHMLRGVLECRDGNEPIVNICDSGGKSDLVFGLSSLLNISLQPRPRSRNLKLWAPEPGMAFDNLSHFAGAIRWDTVEAAWQDMLWILASIARGSAPPDVILERLAAKARHPATKGFAELRVPVVAARKRTLRNCAHSFGVPAGPSSTDFPPL